MLFSVNILIISTHMKTSSSKDRSITQTSYKSSVPPASKPKTPLGSLNMNVNVIGKKTGNSKALPPKPSPKTQYNVEINMTQSKIFQAKKGLQLLKRKMNRTGMSRQKNHSHSEKTEEIAIPFNRENSNQKLKTEKTKPQPREYLNKRKQQTQILPPTSETKQMAAKVNPVQNQRQYFKKPHYQRDERPINHNNNFMDLLDQELKKEETNIKKNNVKKNRIVNQKEVDITLQICSKGCGRMFNPQALQKHEKVCEKVFQSKRKAFNSAIHRQSEAEGYQPKPLSKIQKAQSKLQKRKNEIPKWKLQSAAFRAKIKQGKNEQLTNQQQAILQINQDSRVCCEFCGRRFSDEAAKKHVPFCQRKSKQISKNNTRIKK